MMPGFLRLRPSTKPLIVEAAHALTREQGGSAAHEMALVATPLFLLLFGIMEFGRAIWLQSALHYSAEEAARCASVNTILCGTTDQIKSFAAGRSGAGFANATFTPSTATCGNKVTASYPMTLNIPIGTYSITLSAQSCYPK